MPLPNIQSRGGERLLAKHTEHQNIGCRHRHMGELRSNQGQPEAKERSGFGEPGL